MSVGKAGRTYMLQETCFLSVTAYTCRFVLTRAAARDLAKKEAFGRKDVFGRGMWEERRKGRTPPRPERTRLRRGRAGEQADGNNRPPGPGSRSAGGRTDFLQKNRLCFASR